MNECWVVKLYDDKEIRGVFATEEEARTAAQRWLDKKWAADEEMIKEAQFYGENDVAESFSEDLKSEKEQWEEDGFISDMLYIDEAPYGVLETIDEGNFYGNNMTEQFYEYLKELQKRGFTTKEIEQLIERFNYSEKSRNKVFGEVRHMILWRK